MIRCDECGTFYEELTHNNCPKCGEKAHKSVGRCLLCGKEAERGDVCNKCIKDYQIKAEDLANADKQSEMANYKHSNSVGWLRALAGFVAFFTFLGALILIALKASVGLIVADIIGGIFSYILIKCVEEHFDYMEHMTKQLEEIKEIIKMK